VTTAGAGVGAYFWWQHYKTTPAYSIALLADAAQRNDQTTVDQLIDSDKIADAFALEVSEKAANRYGSVLKDSLRKQINELLPSLLPVIKQQVHDGVAARVKQISESADKKPFIVIALGVPYVVNITTAGDRAQAKAQLRDQHFEVEMQRDGDAWKVVAVHDDALVQQVVDEVIKSLPAIGGDLDPRKRFKKLAGNLSPLPGLR